MIGLDFSGGAASVATQLQAVLGGGFAVSNPSGNVLRVLDDGAAGTTDVAALTTRTTVTGNQGAGLGLSLFVDSGNADFTNSLDGKGQKLGFACRISVNSAILNDNRLMVQYQVGGSLGDADRANYLGEQLETMQFAMSHAASDQHAAYRISGTVCDLIAQTINYQGNSAALAISDAETQELTLETLTQRLETRNTASMSTRKWRG